MGKYETLHLYMHQKSQPQALPACGMYVGCVLVYVCVWMYACALICVFSVLHSALLCALFMFVCILTLCLCLCMCNQLPYLLLLKKQNNTTSPCQPWPAASLSDETLKSDFRGMFFESRSEWVIVKDGREGGLLCVYQTGCVHQMQGILWRR